MNITIWLNRSRDFARSLKRLDRNLFLYFGEDLVELGFDSLCGDSLQLNSVDEADNSRPKNDGNRHECCWPCERVG
ncbi:MAG: hypothetical protein DCC67_05725 [Planctomycetota bacterium]|nr:MAG: hypothetical protein DCC67_05725 [Planctomycetota bacterium]